MPERYPNTLGGSPFFQMGPQAQPQPQQPQQQDMLSALLPALMGMGGGGGQNPIAALLGGSGGGLGGMLSGMGGGGQQSPQAQVGMGDIQRLLMMQGMQNSPFYQGQYVPGAGAQIAGALMPFLMARAQAPLLQQQMQQAQQKQQLEALKIYFDALASQNEMALTKAKTKTEGAKAQKYTTEAQAIPAELMQEAELKMQKMGLDREKFRSLADHRELQSRIALQEMRNLEAYRSKRLAQGSAGQRGILKPVGDGDQQEWMLFDPITGKSISTGRRAPKAAGPGSFLEDYQRSRAGAGDEDEGISLFDKMFGRSSDDAITITPEAQKKLPGQNKPPVQPLRGGDQFPGSREPISEFGKTEPMTWTFRKKSTNQ